MCVVFPFEGFYFHFRLKPAEQALIYPEAEDICLMHWLAISPDLNPTEKDYNNIDSEAASGHEQSTHSTGNVVVVTNLQSSLTESDQITESVDFDEIND
ncbi:hypothetical protein AVEN_71923-1 [Araneus ventricosus]|uniref:Uncharacterized protein n=1 Tax=Araneus ventricosus TaxID=182803 RepID=A0A4Y2TUF9_ARAVE|nr:hypothetical protein AVEN_71923-1 [Araneus ventricosus]